MSSVLRHFRGLGVALAALAISAGAVFAAAPSLQPTSSHHTIPAANAAEASETAEATQSAEASKSAEPSESPEPSESEPAASQQAAASPAASPSADTHGTLVSTAAQMPTPSGFPNHGAFVRCVAHMNVSATGFDWTTVTPASCGISASPTTHGQSGTTHGKASSHVPQGKGPNNH